MKSVTQKTLVKPKAKQAHWYKTRVHFPSQYAVNDCALRCAIQLRAVFPGLYFARYNSDRHWVDFYVQCYGLSPRAAEREKIKKIITATCHARRGSPNIAVEPPVDHEGSEAHAAGFDCVVKLCRAFCLTDDDAEVVGSQQEMNHALADVQHWMCNMFGIDYGDEARLALYTLGRIVDNTMPQQPPAAKAEDLPVRKKR